MEKMEKIESTYNKYKEVNIQSTYISIKKVIN